MVRQENPLLFQACGFESRHQHQKGPISQGCRAFSRARERTCLGLFFRVVRKRLFFQVGLEHALRVYLVGKGRHDRLDGLVFLRGRQIRGGGLDLGMEDPGEGALQLVTEEILGLVTV